MRSVVNIALVLTYAVLVPIVGLFASTGGYLIVHMLYLGVRPIPLVLGIAAGSVFVMYLFFGLLLGVQLNGTWLI